jgi:recombination protein RecA
VTDQKPTAAELLKELNKMFGEGTVRMGNDPSLKTKWLPTGVFPIDVLLKGGLPRGRFTEIYGAYSTLKSFIGYRAIATTQQAGGVCALIDTEHAYDPDWFTELGGDPNTLLYKTPETGEEAVDLSEMLIRNGVDLIVWDSVAATLPQDEGKKRMSKENIQPARLAALMSAASRRLTAANKTTAVLFINQTRINVGQMFGDPTAIPGGKALPYYASYRIGLNKAGNIRRTAVAYTPSSETLHKIDKGTTNEIIAYKIKAVVEKSKLNAPFREQKMLFDLTTGTLDDIGFLISHSLEQGWITKPTNQTYQVGKRKPMRSSSLRGWLEANPAVRQELMDRALPDPNGSHAAAKKRVVRRKPKPPRK